jgi:hypothetical protein
MLVCQLYGRAGDVTGASAALARVRELPIFEAIREPVWLAMLVDAVHLCDEEKMAASLYPKLLPVAHRFSQLGPLGPNCEPPFARQCGLLAETLGRADDAVMHFEDSERRTAAARMKSHLARSRFELARALRKRGRDADVARTRDLLRDAQAIAEALGQRDLLVQIAKELEARSGETAAGVGGTGASPLAARLSIVLEGDVWALRWGDRTLRLKDGRGVQVLARLIESPGEELHVLQLMGSFDADVGDAGAHLDPTALQSYRARLLDLRDALSEAESFADTTRADRARAEIDAITHELAHAVGLGGRERRAGAAAERARTTVKKRLKSTVDRIAADWPSLATHLDQTLHTGVFCGYFPEGRRRKH